ncbi:hypothetical protein J6590_003314 [Homalodisca vitripennis]|nr:hypothetical protein J6590_003314 [Homalodisca vitripennis]
MPEKFTEKRLFHTHCFTAMNQRAGQALPASTLQVDATMLSSVIAKSMNPPTFPVYIITMHPTTWQPYGHVLDRHNVRENRNFRPGNKERDERLIGSELWRKAKPHLSPAKPYITTKVCAGISAPSPDLPISQPVLTWGTAAAGRKEADCDLLRRQGSVADECGPRTVPESCCAIECHQGDYLPQSEREVEVLDRIDVERERDKWEQAVQSLSSDLQTFMSSLFYTSPTQCVRNLTVSAMYQISAYETQIENVKTEFKNGSHVHSSKYLENESSYGYLVSTDTGSTIWGRIILSK